MSAAGATAFAVDDFDFRNGVFIVNEDWYGHQNSTINWISDNWEWTYRVFQQANEGHELGCTNQYGQIYGDRFFLVAKQEKDPGASVIGGRITVADARTMKMLYQSPIIDPSGNQCDGRGCLGIDEHKLYISTSNGVWIFDTDSYKVTGMVEGTANPNGGDGKPNTDPTGSLYHGQCGSMVRVNDRVFVAHQQDGLLVVDPETDKVTDVFTMQPIYDLLPEPEEGKTKKMPGIGSVVLAKDGSLWVSVAKDIQGQGASLPYLIQINPATLEYKVIEVPEGMYPPSNSWYAWTPDGFCASARENVLYWNGGTNSWFSNTKIFRYDIDKDEFSLIIDLDEEAREEGLGSKEAWKLYGCSLREQPSTGRLYMSLFHYFQNPTYKLRVTESDGTIVKEVDMISNYWFPSLPVFPDNESPVAHDPGEIICNPDGETVIPLNEVFTDDDSLEAAIVKKVTNIDGPDTFTAKVLHGDLVIYADNVTDGTTATVDVTANSNGQFVTLPVSLCFRSSGIGEIIVEEKANDGYYTIDGTHLPGYPSSRGVYIVVKDGKSSKIVLP